MVVEASLSFFPLRFLSLCRCQVFIGRNGNICASLTSGIALAKAWLVGVSLRTIPLDNNVKFNEIKKEHPLVIFS